MPGQVGPAGSGGGSAQGTTDTIAKFTSENALGDSTTTDDGTSVVSTASFFRPATNGGLTLGLSNRRFATLFVTAVNADGTVTFTGLPTSDPAVAGQLWSNVGVVMVSAG